MSKARGKTQIRKAAANSFNPFGATDNHYKTVCKDLTAKKVILQKNPPF